MRWSFALDGGPRRVNHAAVAIGKKIYSFGGYCSGEQLDAGQLIDVHVLDTETYRWKPVKTTAPIPDVVLLNGRDYGFEQRNQLPESLQDKRIYMPYQRYGHTICVLDDKAYMWGGRNDELGSTSALHEFDPETCVWSIVPVNGRIPPARDGHTAVIIDRKMYLFGGFEEELQRFSQETFVYDFDLHKWTEMQTNGDIPTWRDFHTATAIGSKMYIFGGRSDQMGQFHSTKDVYDGRLKILDVTTSEWYDPDPSGSLPNGRRSHSAWCYKNKMFIFGGYFGTDNVHYQDLYCYDPSENKWSQIQPFGTPPSPRRRQCTVIVGNRVFLFGGTMPLHSIAGAAGSGLADLADLHVLDHCPTLYSHSIGVVISSLNLEMLRSIVPPDISMDICLMTTNNTISGSAAARNFNAG